MDDSVALDQPLQPAAPPAHAAPFRPWVLIAAKRFGRAKSRLAAALPLRERRALAGAMFESVLDASAHCTQSHGTLVATDGDDVAALARRRSAVVLRDVADSPLSNVIDAGLANLRARGATHALVMMADLPLLESRDIAELLASMRVHAVLVTPDLQRRGTSALGVRLDLGFHSCFGHEDSLQRHMRQAARMSTRCAVHYHPRIAFDVDTPEDLARWRVRARG